MGRIGAVLAVLAALLVGAAPATADAAHPGAPQVSVSTHFTQGVETVMPSFSQQETPNWRISNSPVVDADGMLVYGVTTSDIWADWDVTAPPEGTASTGRTTSGCSSRMWPAPGETSAAPR